MMSGGEMFEQMQVKLRHVPDLNILSRSTPYLQKSLNRSCNQERFRSCNGAHRLERVTPVPHPCRMCNTLFVPRGTGVF
jgi:hypothetical protein